jgi:predicted ATP-dependent endonuclease of OLD family
MKINSLTIKNIKSFNEKNTINFNANLNIFVGKNGGGKSTILNILKLLMNYPMIKHSEYLKKLSEATLVKNQNNTEKNSILECEIEIFEHNFAKFERFFASINERSEIHVQSLKARLPILRDKLKSELVNLGYNGKSLTLDLEYDFKKNKLKPKDRSFNKIFLLFLRITSISYGVIAKQMGEHGWDDFMDKGMASQLRSLSPTMSILSKRVSNILIPPRNKYLSLYEGELMGNLIGNISFIQSLPDNQQSVSETFASKHFSKLSINHSDIKIKTSDREPKQVLVPDGEKIYGLRHYNQDASRNILINDCSDGEYSLLNLQILRSYNIKNSIIFIDEPELHLHPQAQKEFLSRIKEIIQEEEGPQIFISTHSPILTNNETILSSFVVNFDKDTQSSIVKKFDSSKSNDKSAELVNLEFAEKALFADKIVLVEGKSDKALFDILLSHNNNKKHITEIIAVGGKESFDPYKKLLDLIQFDKDKIFTIADRDYIKQKGSDKIKGDLEKVSKDIDLFVSDEEGKILLNNEIDNLYKDNIFILKEGELEDYLKNIIIKTKLDLSEFPIIKNQNGNFVCKVENGRLKPEQNITRHNEELFQNHSGSEILLDGGKATDYKIKTYLSSSDMILNIITKYPELANIRDIIIN